MIFMSKNRIINLKTIWQTQVNGTVSEDLAQRHLAALDATTETVEPVVNCDLYEGLLIGRPDETPVVNPAVLGFLKELERVGRTIVILHTTFSAVAGSDFSQVVPVKAWMLQNKLSMLPELTGRASGQKPKAELAISKQNMPLDPAAHISVLSPSELTK